jgi:hypothetical protein
VNVFTSAKARLVVCANWIQGVFRSLFAPTVNEKSMKLLFAIAVIFGLMITGIDVKVPFFVSRSGETVSQLVTPVVNHTASSKKTLYGLPDSPQAFYRRE